ncbi:ABC transporter ATP-binding protein [Desulfoprunum benzoelyticum]|uniref:NitT/TauT family transport system ATP-binding protein n=1 Tax=Desulfoprunum benzoelyticum TaxID=1506996 RepID=A0A840UP98_9BACT|nr:ABC transporter ATP-binding protein [Desulfoprunum benzoelyticum]MBB5346656.1 NitT/TauT family transport system ATP-binding protein [Desulfoprunum benzoelyticum]MBM9529099.1 ABC transporter ATP-binding protein [Desulfoprunum benzoelyticum]
MIRVDSVNLSFSHEGEVNQVLQGISFAVKAEGSCAIIGPSGCGKTSLLFLLAGLLQPDAGTITITGSPRTGTILQHYGLFPWKTVVENIGLGLQLKGEAKDRIGARVEGLLAEMGLTGFGRHYPAQLSGGMQQRVAMARALAIEPQILFMDEPLSSLDALSRERLQNLILQVWRDKRITTILVTHSIEEAVYLGRQIIVLSQRPGRILQIVDNPGAGSREYRQTEQFFHNCNQLRRILKEEDHGPEA